MYVVGYHHHLKVFLVCRYVSDMDFTTPRCKSKATLHEMNEDDVNTDDDDNDVNTATVTSIASNLRPQVSSII